MIHIIATAVLLLANSPLLADEPSVRMYQIGADISSSTIRQAREAALSTEVENRRQAMEFFAWQAQKYANLASPEILKGLQDEDSIVRAQAAIALKSLKQLNQQEVEALLAELWKRDPLAAALASVYKDIRTERVARALLEGLRLPEPLCGWAGFSFQKLGAGGHFVQEDLIRLIDDADSSISCNAMMALSYTPAPPARLVPRMIAMVKENHDCAGWAMAVLGAIGPAAAAAVPLMISRIHGERGQSNSWEGQYLVGIGTPAIPALLSMAQESNEFRRGDAVLSLGRLAPLDERAEQRVFEALDESSHEVAGRAASGLGMRVPGPTNRIARRLFARILSNGRMGSREEIKLLKTMLPLPPEHIFSVPTSTEVSVRLSPPSASAHRSGKPVFLDMKLTNISSKAIRIINPSCGAESDPAEIIIFKEPGYPLFQLRHSFFHMEGPAPNGEGSTLLAPKQSASFRCFLEAAEETEGKRNFQRSGFTWSDVGLETKQPSRLLPGKYRIRVRYRMNKTVLHCSRDWDENLTRRLGALWMGEAYSNEVMYNVQ